MPSYLHPRPGTASAVDRLSIGRLVGEQCNFGQSSIVARMSSRAMQNGRSWVKKRNLGQKNETRAEKTGLSALLRSVSIERGVGIRKNFLGLANNSFAPHRWFSGATAGAAEHDPAHRYLQIRAVMRYTAPTVLHGPTRKNTQPIDDLRWYSTDATMQHSPSTDRRSPCRVLLKPHLSVRAKAARAP